MNITVLAILARILRYYTALEYSADCSKSTLLFIKWISNVSYTTILTSIINSNIILFPCALSFPCACSKIIWINNCIGRTVKTSVAFSIIILKGITKNLVDTCLIILRVFYLINWASIACVIFFYILLLKCTIWFTYRWIICVWTCEIRITILTSTNIVYWIPKA